MLLAGSGADFNRNPVVRYNISQNDKSEAFHVYGGPDSYGHKIYNNTIYTNVAQGKFLGTQSAMGYPHDMEFKNNIYYNAASGGAVASDYTNISGLVFDYNLFYGNYSSVLTTLDTHDITTNPMLVNPGSGSIGRNTVDGYKLQTGSPAMGSGMLISGNGGSTPTPTPASTPTLVATTLLDQNFNSDTTGALPSGSTESISGRVTTVEDPSASDKSMRVGNLSTDTANTITSKSFTSSSGTVTVTYKFKTEQINTGTQLDILDTTGTYQSGAVSFASTGKITYKSNGSWVTTSMAYTANTWYDVKIVLNMSNKTYSIYVNNMTTPLVSDKTFASTSATNAGLVRVTCNHLASASTGAKVNDLLIIAQ